MYGLSGWRAPSQVQATEPRCQLNLDQSLVLWSSNTGETLNLDINAFKASPLLQESILRIFVNQASKQVVRMLVHKLSHQSRLVIVRRTVPAAGHGYQPGREAIETSEVR